MVYVTITVDLFDVKTSLIGILDGFYRETYGISNENSLNGKAYSLAEFILPENIYEVGGQYSNSGQLGVFHYDLFDKVTHEGSDYYYMSILKIACFIGTFLSNSEISNGTFSLSFPRKGAEELFTNSSLDGTNSVIYFQQ